MDYHRYGVNENPYDHVVLTIDKIDAFENIHTIDPGALTQALKSALAKPAFSRVVVTGTSGSGRTAVGRYVMARYGQLFRESEGKICAGVAFHERQHDGNVDSRQVAREVLKGLADEVKLLGAEFKDGPVKELRQELKELRNDYSVQDLQSLASDFAKGVHDRHGSFACLVENVPNVDVFNAANGIFRKSKSLVVTTIVGEKRNEVLGQLKAEEIGEELHLDILQDDLACHLAEQRWKRCRATPPLPFEPEALRKVFHDRPRTVGKSLKTLAFMVDSKLINYPGQGSHPGDAGLRFDEKQIRDNFVQFDKALK